MYGLSKYRDLVHSTGWVKKPDTIEIQTSIIAFLQFDGRWCKTKSNSLWKLKYIILAVQDL